MEEALGRATAGGATRAEVFFTVAEGRVVEYADRGLETYRGSAARGLALRVFRGRKVGFSYSQDCTPAGLGSLAGRALAAASLADLPAFPTPAGRPVAEDLHLLDGRGLAATVAQDRERIEEVVRRARAAEPSVRRVKTVSLRRQRREVRVASTAGTDAAYAKSSFTLVAGVVASRGGESEMGWEADTGTHRDALDWAGVGPAASRRAAERLGAGRCPAGRQPVILAQEVVADFVSILGSALSADAVLKKKSLYAGREGSVQAAAAVTLLDDPTLAGVFGSAPCDDEGQATGRKELIAGGVLRGFLHSLETAHRMGTAPTGNGFRRDFTAPPLPRAGNLVLEPGRGAPAAWVAAHGTLLEVDEVLGAHTINPVSGDFSLGAAGFVHERGRRRPFRGATIAGNLRDLFLGVAEVGGELRFFGSIGAPAVLIRELDVSS
jgi:PmbA protein